MGIIGWDMLQSPNPSLCCEMTFDVVLGIVWFEGGRVCKSQVKLTCLRAGYWTGCLRVQFGMICWGAELGTDLLTRGFADDGPVFLRFLLSMV